MNSPSPNTIESLFARWKEARESGNPITPQELCKDTPDLLPHLLKHIEADPSQLRQTQHADTVGDHLAETPRSDHPDSSAPSLADEETITRIPRPLEVGTATATYQPDKPSHTAIRPNIPGFEVQELLGVGGMGEVWKVEKITLGMRITFAMKVLRKNLIGQSAYDRFAREAKTLVDLQHDHIVRIFEVGEHNDVPYLTMRCLSGGSLAKRINEWKKEIPQSVALIATIAKATAYAHERGIIHRDIKPGNVLFDEKDTPYLADFGILRAIDDPTVAGERTDSATTTGFRNGRTTTGTVLGTPEYMPPEQWEGDFDRIGKPADVFALGVMLYELTVGKRPFVIESVAEAIRTVPTRTYIRPTEVNPTIDPALETIICKCLEPDPAARYQDAGELVKALEEWSKPTPPPPPPVVIPPETKPAGRWYTRRSVLGTSTVLGVGAAIGGWFFFREKKPPLGPREQMLREFEETGRVNLLDEHGKPRWHEWQVGETMIDDAPDGEKGFTFTHPPSSQVCLLELIRGLPNTAFRIKAEIRHLVGQHATVGVYWGRSKHPTPYGFLHCYVGLTWGDIEEVGIPRGTPAAMVMSVKDREAKDVSVPGVLVRTDPLDGYRKCRHVTIDLHLSMVNISVDGASAQPFGRSMIVEMGGKLQRGMKGYNDVDPKFKPDEGIGIFSKNASVLVRDFSIEALDTRHENGQS